MKISSEGLALLKRFEGCKLYVYLDPVGIPTAGYGTTKGLTKAMVGQPVTQEQADQWLKEDLEKFEKKVMKYDPIYHFSSQEFSSLVCFSYNIGNIDGLTAKGTRTRQEIADAMLKYNTAKGKVLNGLTKRRQAERELFLKGNSKTYPTVRRGYTGEAVKELQKLLGLPETGYAGCETEVAIIAYQKEHGLVPDGICGTKTWAELLKS